MKRLLTALVWGALLGAPLAGRAQNELSNFGATGRGGVANTFVTDYQAIGINPANLARIGNAKFAVGVGQFGVGLASQSLTREQLFRFVKRVDDPLTPAEKQELAQAFTSDNALNLNADVTTFGLSVALPGVGTFAVSNQQRVVGHVGLNKNMAELLFLGRNAPIYQNYDPRTSPLVSEALAGTELQMSALNLFNIAYGTRLLDRDMLQLTAGVGYSYIEGLGIVDIRINPGKLEAYSSMSPLFDINYGQLANNPQFNSQSGSGLKPVGKGHAVDLGLAMEVGKSLRLGLSVTDLGRMTWEGNLVTASDQRLKRLQTTGIDTYNFIREATQFVAAGTDSLFQYQASARRKADLPTKLRGGAGVRISEYFEAGLDVTLPLNGVAGNLSAPFVGAGLDYKPLKWLRLSSGVTAGAGYRVGLPLGVTLTTSVYEAGISTRDVAGLLSNEHPYASVAAGFLRFRFGQVK